MTNVSDYADKSCSFCFGKGEVIVQRGAAWRATAVCSCVRQVHRCLTADVVHRARRLRR